MTTSIEKLESARPETTLDFFESMYGIDKLTGSIVISQFNPTKKIEWRKTIEQAASVIEQWKNQGDIYYGVGLQGGEQPYPNARGKANNVIAIPGLWADVDYGKKESVKKYPPTINDALSFLDGLRRKPNLVIHSGGGLHAYWLFAELWVLGSDGEREKAKRISEGWTRYLQKEAGKKGWDLDSVFDLARVLRPVGTFNEKYEIVK